MLIGEEPLAMIIFLVSIISGLLSIRTSTWLELSTLASPNIVVTLFALNKPPTPVDNCATTLFFLSIILGISSFGLETSIPWSEK